MFVRWLQQGRGEETPKNFRLRTAILYGLEGWLAMTGSSPHDPYDAAPLVAFGVCTFRRAGLVRTLRSLAAQNRVTGSRFCIIVADNDDTPSSLPLVESVRAELSMPLHYVQAPARNISIARNALLARAVALGAKYLAMIDDDEEAIADWAATLLSEITSSRADAVLGPVLARYRDEAPEWMRKANLHDVRPVVQPNGRILTGFTGNVILNLNSPHLRDRRFDLAYGRTGGEDDAFFRGMVRDGGTIGYAPEAIAHEEIPPQRETLGFLLRRNFRAGQTHGRINSPGRAASRTTFFAKAAAKAFVLLVIAGCNAAAPARCTQALMRASLHAGVCSQLLGGKILELYRS